MDGDNVDRRLLARFEASRAHERARRELLPPEWLNAVPPPIDRLDDLFAEVLGRARERVRSQREATISQPPDITVTKSARSRDTSVTDPPIS
jgi:hypothetical protein